MRAPFPAMTENNTARMLFFWMLDELFTALDVDSTTTVKRLLRIYVGDLQIPCILVTQRVTDMQDIGDACIISRGTIGGEGRPLTYRVLRAAQMDLRRLW